MLDQVIPACAVGVEAFDDAGAGPLLGEEREAIRRAVPIRVAEYTTVRHCARRALGRLGIAPVPIVRGPGGAPIWPDTVVGSMTHCLGYRAAAVARETDLLGLGIDAEPDLPLPEGTLDVVSSADERTHIAGLPAGPAWDRLLFCVKESVYKVWSPLMRSWLDFSDATVTFEGDGTATARLSGRPLVVGQRVITELPIRWVVQGGLLVTAVAVRA